jgi:hypothetical protein
VADVYEYWRAKRAARGCSLLRRFIAPTPPDDMNPHHVFRPREKVHTRKHRGHRRTLTGNENGEKKSTHTQQLLVAAVPSSLVLNGLWGCLRALLFAFLRSGTSCGGRARTTWSRSASCSSCGASSAKCANSSVSSTTAKRSTTTLLRLDLARVRHLSTCSLSLLALSLSLFLSLLSLSPSNFSKIAVFSLRTPPPLFLSLAR